jgi:hypothetical protein
LFGKSRGKQKARPAFRRDALLQEEVGLTFLQKGQTGAGVFRNDIAGWKGIKGIRTRDTCEVVKGDFGAAFEFLNTIVKEIGFSAFFADDAKGHN